MKRRHFITLLGGAAVWPLAARAQQPPMPVVGFVRDVTPDVSDARATAFRQALKEAGFVEGQNVAIEYRSEQTDRLPLVVADLLRRQVALIVGNTPSALAAKTATMTVPIVFVTGGDPVRVGLVANLNRPGGNVTGISFMSVELAAKQLGLLRELRPGAARIAVLVDPKFPTTERFVSEVRAAASAIGQQIEVLYVSSDREIETAFTTLVQRGAGAHAASPTDAWRQAGIYAGRILKGEKPGDLPVMLPTKFELVINVKTAKTLGIEIPDRLLALADEVIE